MLHARTHSRPLVLTLFTLAALLSGCDKKPAPGTTASGGKTAPHDDHEHVEGDDHDDAATDEHDDHGPAKPLGEKSVDGLTVRASRDGDIVAGDEAAVDVWVTGAATPIAAVRFWIGARDGRGSVKAKAELEEDNWHTHIEVPKPLPAGSELWVEIEAEGGKKSLVAFALQN